MTYASYANKAVSEKTTLVTLQGKQRVINFASETILGVPLRTKVLDHVVFSVNINGTETQVFITSVQNSTFYNIVPIYNPETKLLTIPLGIFGTTTEVVVTYEFYFADRPVNLEIPTRTGVNQPLLFQGPVVEWEPRVQRVPGFSTQLSFGKNNKTIVGNGQLVLDNSDKYFNTLFKNIRFDNKPFVAYSVDVNQDPIVFQKIYEGVLNNSSLRSDRITFNIKDSIFNLNQEVPFMEQFTSSEVIEQHTKRFKKRVFGFVNGMAIQSVSQVGDGYNLTGNISGISRTNELSGIGTTFLSELAPRDKIVIGSRTIVVRRVISNNFLLLAEDLEGAVSTDTALVIPSRPWYNTNRKYSICSRPIYRGEAVIADLNDRKRIIINPGGASIFDPNVVVAFTPGTKVIISGETYAVVALTNINNQPIVELDRTLSPNNLPSIGDLIIVREVQQVKLLNETILDADYTIDNPGFNISPFEGECFLNLSENAERDIAPQGTFGNEVTAVANSNYFVLGTPTIQNIQLAQNGTWRGVHLRLARQNDTSTTSGPFVWFGSVSGIREFTTAAADLASFAQGDIYLNTTDNKYFGVRGAGTGLTATLLDMGSAEPIRVQIPDSDVTNGAAVSALLQNILGTARTIQLFNFIQLPAGTVVWRFFTNQGIAIVGNTITVGVTGGPTIDSNSTTTGSPPSLDISLSEGLRPRDFVRVQGQSNFSQVVQAESKFIQVSETISQQFTDTCTFLNPTYATDTSLTTVDCFGEAFRNHWTKSPRSTISSLLFELNIPNNFTSFGGPSAGYFSNKRPQPTAGIYFPYSLASKPPKTIDAVNKLSISDLSAVALNDNFQLEYIELNGAKPSSFSTIRRIGNDDLTESASLSIKPSSLFRYTVNNFEATYDIGEADSSDKLLRITDPKILALTDLDTTEDHNFYLPELSDTTFLADRYLNYSQQINQIVTLRGSLSFHDIQAGQVVLLDVEGVEENFIGMVTGFARNGNGIELRVEDMGGLFIRSANTTADSSSTFSAASNEDKLLGSYYTDDQGIIDNDETILGQNAYA